jgi:hypothetical protein
MTRKICYDNSRTEKWKKVPGVTKVYASTLGPIRAGECVLTARYLPGSGLYVPVKGIWLPAHILVAVTHLPKRPNYSWFEIISYTSRLVQHENGDKVDNRAVNLRWAEHPGGFDYGRLLHVPRYYRKPSRRITNVYYE